MAPKFFEEKIPIFSSKQGKNIEDCHKHLEYALSILGQLLEITEYYEKEKSKYTIENRDCRNAIHNVLEKVQLVCGNISQLLDTESVNYEKRYENIQACWLTLRQDIEKMEITFKSSNYFNSCPKADKQLATNIFELVKSVCIEVPKTYIASQLYAKASFRKFLVKIRDLVTERPSCFICYSWMKNSHYNRWIKKLVKDLNTVGIKTIFDLSQNAFGKISDFTELINEAEYIIIVGSQDLLWKWQNSKDKIINKELGIIKELIVNKKNHKIIKVLYSGHPNGLESFPDFLQDHSHYATNFSNPSRYYLGVFNLLSKLYENDKKISGYILLAKDFFITKNKLNSSKYGKLNYLNVASDEAKEINHQPSSTFNSDTFPKSKL